MRHWIWLALLPAAPQDDTDLLGVPEWHGFVRITLINKGRASEKSGSGESVTRTWDESEELYVEGTLDHGASLATLLSRNNAGAPPDKGRFRTWASDPAAPAPHAILLRGLATARTHELSRGEAGSPIHDTESTRQERRGAGQARTSFRLQIDRATRTYAFSLPHDALVFVRPTGWTLKSTRHQQPVSGRDETRIETLGQSGSVVQVAPGDVAAVSVIEEALPSGTQELKGTRSLPLQMKSPPPGVDKVDTRLEVQWSFSPKPPERYTLELEAVAAQGSYADWRPRPGPDEATAGDVLKVVARLHGPRGRARDRVQKLSLRLVGVSRERGLSINYPVDPASAPAPDLRFTGGGPKVKVFDEEAYAVDGDIRELRADLSCYDGGAWGEIVGVCELASGRRIVGRLKGRPDRTSLLVPDRDPGSRIARGWRAPGTDDQDGDAQPVGDPAAKGDGLTNYEEYRGFHVGGAWTEGDPQKKDFFLRDETGGLAVAGITLFERLTGLRVHRLAVDEFPGSRVVNANRTDGPQAVEQHGIRIISDPTLNYCQAVGPAVATPKDIVHVVLGSVPTNPVTAAVSGGGSVATTYDAVTVAHELLHCCNVRHHGDAPDEGEKTWTKTSSGILEGGAAVQVLDEAGNDIGSLVPFPAGGPKVLKLGRRHGSHSGDLGCVMRYDDADGRLEAAPGKRTLFKGGSGSGVSGAGLCTGADGAPPNVRFGPAAPGRGNCAAQVHVNDAIPPRPR